MHANFDHRRYLIPFRSALLPQIFTDVLVIGAGVAGLQAALAAATHSDVIVLAKASLEESNTAWAQGGIAAVVDTEHDTIEAHVRNTLETGAELCDEPVVRRIVEAGPEQMRHLVDLGMPFDRHKDGRLHLGREGGHTAHRVLHAHGDATGKALAETLIAAVAAHDSVRVFNQCFALDLLTDPAEEGRCLGAITYHPRYGLQMIWAAATILASGGCGQVFRESTNPPVATGDGLAMAYRAGAELADLEFTQFHPTTLYIAGASRSLISEAVRGEGAYLVNGAGERFMVGQHELAELAPRDTVSRAILRQLAADARGIYLDVRHLDTGRFSSRFPGIAAKLREFDLDPGRHLIPIRPAAHYLIGGVRVDERSRTSLEGLYACGEVACTGLHGANRLASNSLLEGLVCGEDAGRDCHDLVRAALVRPRPIVSDIRISQRPWLDLADITSSLKSLMWRQMGIERRGDQLAGIVTELDHWAGYTLDKIFDEREGWEVQNQLWTAALLTRSALARTESRGTHCRLDFPERRADLRVHLVWQRGRSTPATVPVAHAQQES